MATAAHRSLKALHGIKNIHKTKHGRRNPTAQDIRRPEIADDPVVLQRLNQGIGFRMGEGHLTAPALPILGG